MKYLVKFIYQEKFIGMFLFYFNHLLLKHDIDFSDKSNRDPA